MVSIAVVLGLFLVACDDTPAQNAVAVSSEKETLRVHYALCPGETVEHVELIEISGVVAGDSDDVVHWAISSPAGSSQQVYEVGVTPEGFSEAAPFRGRLPDAGRLAASVDTSGASGVLVSFDPDDLPVNKVLTGHGEKLTLADFEERAALNC